MNAAGQSFLWEWQPYQWQGSNTGVLVGDSWLCPLLRPPEEEVQVQLFQDLVLKEQRRADLSCPGLVPEPWPFSGRDWCCDPRWDAWGVTRPMLPTLGPCILNKDIYPPTFAYASHCARSRTPMSQHVLGALAGHSSLSHFFFVAVIKCGQGNKREKEFVLAPNSRLQSVTEVKPQQAGLGTTDHMTSAVKNREI